MRDFRGQPELDELLDEERPRKPAPGRVALTSSIPGTPGGASREVEPHPLATPVQLSAAPDPRAPVIDDPFAVHQTAARGVASGGGPLPHLDAIQASFGHHDVGEVRAHVGGAAADASRAIGADAYATGDQVAFAAAPDLHTAAHEAAHVVQQRGGVRLAGGVGHAGDPYEQHADAVADKVVRGESAESLLDTMAHRGAGGGKAVQGRAVQMRLSPAQRRMDSDALVAHARELDRRVMGGDMPEAERATGAQELIDIYELLQGRIDRGEWQPHRSGDTSPLAGLLDDLAPFGNCDAWHTLARQPRRARPRPARAAERGGARGGEGGGAGGGDGARPEPRADGGGERATPRTGERAEAPAREPERREAPARDDGGEELQFTVEFPDRDLGQRSFSYVTVKAKLGGQVVVKYRRPRSGGGGGSGGGDGGGGGGDGGPETTNNVLLTPNGPGYQRQVSQEINQRILGFTPSVGGEAQISGNEAHFGVGGQLQAADDTWGVREVNARIDLLNWDREDTSGSGLSFLTAEIQTAIGMPPFEARLGELGTCLIEPALLITFELEPNWPAIGRQLAAQAARMGLVAAEGSLAAEAGMATSLAGPAFAAALGVAAAAAVTYIAYRELSAADEMERVTHVLPDHIYYFCISYTAQFFGERGFSGTHGEAGREAGRAAIRQIASDQHCTVEQVRARALADGARTIYTSVYERAAPRYRDEAADSMGSRVRYAPLIQGCLPKARWGGETFRARGGAHGMPEHGRAPEPAAGGADGGPRRG